MLRPLFCLLPLLLLLSGCTALSDFGSFKFKPSTTDAGTGNDGKDKDAAAGHDQDDSGTNGGHGDGGGGHGDGGTTTDDAGVDGGPKPDPICEAADCDPVAKCDSSTGVAVCTCPSGYFDINEDGTRCVDLNECLDKKLYECDDDASCVNKPGGYTCACNPGFTYNKSTNDCIDSCVVLYSTTCDMTVATCEKPDGGAVCHCNSGYTDVKGDASQCEPDLACMALNCDKLADCDSTKGAPVCLCRSGYIGDGTTCADVDECDANDPKNDCSANALCTNTQGGYACKCKDGFTGDGKTCTDVNECTNNTAQCSSNAKCTNTDGSYTCKCNTGYTGDGFQCVDDDECKLGTATCSSNANCTNAPGSYTCKCKDGYSGNGATCDDINECTAGTANCAANEKCTNTVGSYTCGCDAGYEKNANGQCVDVDECTTGKANCSINAACTNTTGSFTCKCKDGYSGDGVTCKDIDECAPGGGNTCSANAACTNTAGAYTCKCKDGFSGTGFVCDDVDECKDSNLNKCNTTRGTCTNTTGSYTCKCKDGYSGDGITCNDNDECALKTDNCDDSPDACVNSVGGFMCMCPSAYWQGDGVGSNGCYDNVNDCATNNGGCGSATFWKCTEVAGTAPKCDDIDECATNNGNCGAVSAWTCTNKPGALPTCSDKDECTLNTDGCDDSPNACVNSVGSFSCKCPTGYDGNGVGTNGCTDHVDCTGAGSDPCDDLPLATCADTPAGSYTCTCAAGYSGTGVGQNGCCTPDGTTELANPNDKKDNDCDGFIDRPVINAASTTPKPGGASSAAAVSIAVTPSAVSGATLKCVHYKRSSGTPTADKWTTCANPITNPATSTLTTNDGAWRTDIQWVYPSGAKSSIVSYDYYIHSSLHGLTPCTFTPAISDAAWITKAMERLGTPDAGAFTPGTDSSIANPFVRITYNVPLAASFGIPTAGKQLVEMRSLRRRFVIGPATGPNANKYLLILRSYPSRHNGSCKVVNFRVHVTHWIENILPKTQGHEHQDFACDAVVLNRAGAGVCLNAVNGNVVFAQTNNDGISNALGWTYSKQFMWRQLLVPENFTPKCEAKGCDTGDYLYLPDRAQFTLP